MIRADRIAPDAARLPDERDQEKADTRRGYRAIAISKNANIIPAQTSSVPNAQTQFFERTQPRSHAVNGGVITFVG
jgi:hypothetical protein